MIYGKWGGNNMGSNEIIVSDVVYDYCNSFEEIKNRITQCREEISKGVIFSLDENISIKINNKLIDNINVIENEVNKLLKCWNDYLNEMNILNNGFSSKHLFLTEDNFYFKEAINIVENEL